MVDHKKEGRITMEKRKIILCLFLGLFIFTVLQCASLSSTMTRQSIPTESSEVPRITPKELKSLLDTGVEVMIVDARSRGEYDEEHIVGAVLLAEIESRFDELPKETKFVLY